MPPTDLPELVNPVKARMQAGGVSLGMIVRLARSGDVVRIAKSTGHDFVFIDGQHSLFSLETIGHIAQVGLGCGTAVLVRARSCDDPSISLMLDNGVTGIIFPDVNTAAQAQARGRCLQVRADRQALGRRRLSQFRLPAAAVGARACAPSTTSTLVVCMIETREGLANVEEIAAVPGVDVVHVGCNDLLAAMGKPGAFGDPEVVAAVERVIAAAAAAANSPGSAASAISSARSDSSRRACASSPRRPTSAS